VEAMNYSSTGASAVPLQVSWAMRQAIDGSHSPKCANKRAQTHERPENIGMVSPDHQRMTPRAAVNASTPSCFIGPFHPGDLRMGADNESARFAAEKSGSGPPKMPAWTRMTVMRLPPSSARSLHHSSRSASANTARRHPLLTPPTRPKQLRSYQRRARLVNRVAPDRRALLARARHRRRRPQPAATNSCPSRTPRASCDCCGPPRVSASTCDRHGETAAPAGH
jgi:hypothetical protein